MIWKRFFSNIVLVSGGVVLFFLFFNFIKIISFPSDQQVSAQVQEGQEPLGFEDLTPVQDGQEPLAGSGEPLVSIRQRVIIEPSTPEVDTFVPSVQEGQVPLEDTIEPPAPAFQEGQVPIKPPRIPPTIIEQPPVIVERPVEIQRIVEQPAVMQPVIEQQPVVIQQPVVEQIPVQQPVIVSTPQQPPPSNPVVQSPLQQPDVQQVSADVDNINTNRNDINNTNTNTNTNSQTVSIGAMDRGVVVPAVAPAPVAVERVVTTPVTVAKAPVVEVEALPKTGPPVPFWIGLGAVPFGLILRKFAKVKRLAENGNYFWEQKQFSKKYFTP